MSYSEISRSAIINKIISKYNLINPKYLEIGVWTGNTFKDVNTIFKDGVDPGQYCNSECVNYKITSDDFFKNHIKTKYDIIFIDGLHTAYQVSKDIFNAVNNLNPGGWIILDDVFPHCEYEQKRLNLRKSGAQTGDVWKAVYNILDDIIFNESAELKKQLQDKNNLIKEKDKQLQEKDTEHVNDIKLNTSKYLTILYSFVF